MSWNISGTYYAPCSCKVGCPCLLGELEGDQGWCSALLALDIKSGDVDGTDVSGTRAVFAGDWPSGFLSGNGTARLYFDPGSSEQQREALGGVLSGQRGGVFEILSTLITKVLPSREAQISVQAGENETTIKVGDLGQLVIQPMRGPTGELTRLLHGAAAFREDTHLARAHGTRWNDPDLRKWESLGHGEFTEFQWSA